MHSRTRSLDSETTTHTLSLAASAARYGGCDHGDAEDQRDEAHRVARGFVNGLLLSSLIWGVFLCVALALLSRL